MANVLSEEFKAQAKRPLGSERARELAAKSVEARRRKKSAREFALAALNATKTVKGKKVVVKDQMIKAILEKAIVEKDLKSAQYLLELIGESPAQRMELTGKDGAPLVSENVLLTKEQLKALHKQLDEE